MTGCIMRRENSRVENGISAAASRIAAGRNADLHFEIVAVTRRSHIYQRERERERKREIGKT